MTPYGNLVKVVVLLLLGLALAGCLAHGEESRCPPGDRPVDFGPGFLPACYHPGPKLTFPDGEVLPWCGAANETEDCFVYERVPAGCRVANDTWEAYCNQGDY